MTLQLGKHTFLFCVGGLCYVGLEYLWRGWSHFSMFLAGGTCFLLLGKLCRAATRLPLVIQGILGSGIITAVELVTGLLVNSQFTIWDYRQMPLNFLGQICLPYSLLWIPISCLAIKLYGFCCSCLSAACKSSKQTS